MNFREQAIKNIQEKTALVISGGGILGISECYACSRAEEYGFRLQNLTSITGSSVGSIIATGIALGASTDYMKDKMNNLNFNKLKSDDCFLVEGIRLLKKYGLHDTNELRSFLVEMFNELGYNENVTFKELYDKNKVHLTVTYLSLIHI